MEFSSASRLLLFVEKSEKSKDEVVFSWGAFFGKNVLRVWIICTFRGQVIVARMSWASANQKAVMSDYESGINNIKTSFPRH